MLHRNRTPQQPGKLLPGRQQRRPRDVKDMPQELDSDASTSEFESETEGNDGKYIAEPIIHYNISD